MDAVRSEGRTPVVAIVGGGFSGSMAAVQLARLARPGALRVILFERSDRFARGMAYGTDSAHHLLNVPAGLMSALPDEPTHFLDWLRARDCSAHAGTYAPRRIYGDYLEELLRSASRESAIPIDLVSDEIIDLLEIDGSHRFRLATGRGELIEADWVVLALGHPLPKDPAGLVRSGKVCGYVANPWAPGALAGLEPDDPIALIGTGLTAVDQVVEARATGHRGKIYAVSRHGLLPCRQHHAPPRPHFAMGSGPSTARSLVRKVRSEVASCVGEGGDWRSVVDSIRPAAQTLWRSLGDAERSRFIRHVAPHWDAHRHRVAPEVDDILQECRESGRLEVIAGRALAIGEREDRVALTLRRRAGSESETILVSRVVNCTGPSRNIRTGPSPLLRSLIARGIGRPGRLALGLDVGDGGVLIGRDGGPHRRIFALGSLLKEHLWETTAVRELRTQAVDLARLIVDRARP
jgi:uncharacterized NAD(P)/FAD-binding protein YdhS